MLQKAEKTGNHWLEKAMIGYIKGIIEEKLEDRLLVDNRGIGWQIIVPAALLGSDVHTGDEVKLYTYLHVREDAMQLYGFFSRDELDIFGMLLNVSGIGPKGAMGILSALSADDLRFAVLSEDAGRIAQAPGIGKKTAQKLILELKDKFKLDDAFEKKLAKYEEVYTDASGGNAETDAVQALIALGYSGTEAAQAVKKVHADSSMNSEDVLKAALKHIF